MPGSKCRRRNPATRSRIFDEPQQCQHVFDVGGIEKLQSAEFYERDVPTRQLDFKRTAVAGCLEQNGLLFEERAGFAVLQDAFDDEARLVGLVADRHELRFCCGGALGPEVLGETLLGEADDAIGGSQDRLRRPTLRSSVMMCAGGENWSGKSRMFRTVAARNE